MVTINCLLNPITRKTVRAEIEHGKPLSDHLDVPDNVRVFRNGMPYDDEVLFEGDIVDIAVIPQGGESGKSIARSGIIIAAQLGAAALAGPIGLGAVGTSLFIGAVGVGASLGVNALIPIQTPEISSSGEEFQRLGSLTGTRNRVNPYGTVPRVYGHRKIHPPMSAKPFTEIVSNQQFLNLLFCVGYGPVELSNPKIGDTVIGSFDSDNNFTSNGNFEDIEVDVAESPDIYANSVSEDSIGVSLDALNDSAVRTTEQDTERISLDFLFPQGLFALTENAQTATANVSLKIEIRETGTSTWKDLNKDGIPGLSTFGQFFSSLAWIGNGTYVANNKARETFRAGLSVDIEKGQYDIRVTRLTGEGEGVDQEYPQVFDSCSWSVLRSTTYEKPTNMPGVVQIGMRIRATDQLNGVLDNFSVEVQSRLATYNGSSWDEPTFDATTGNGTGGEITSNPAWIMADLLTGDSNARPIAKSRLNPDSFKSWADNCDTESRECNIIIDSQRTVTQTASVIGGAGRGSLAVHDGKYVIIQDTEQSTPVQHFTPRNSWGFKATRQFPDVPHALRMRFVNPDKDWQTDEAIVYDDNYSEDGTNCLFGEGTCTEATEFETVDLEAVTSYEQAWKEGRYRLAESRLRPETYTINVDVENIVCQRGDMVRVSHDIPLWGIGVGGRIKDISGTTLTLDDVVTMESGKDYNIRVRTSSGGSELKSVTTNAGTTDTITVDNTTNLSVGDLFMFGEQGTETQELKVLSIQPQSDLSATLVLVDAAPEIYDADTGDIPEFDSNITTPPDEEPFSQTPPKPTITNVRSDVNVLNRDPNGIPELRIVTSYELGTGNPTDFIEARFKKQNDTTFTSFGTVEASAGSVWLYNVEEGDTYIIQIRARAGNKTSDWVEANPHEAGANITLPPRERLKAIGELKEDVSSEVTEIAVELDVVIRSGYEYWIVNESELSLNDRFAGIYAILPEEVGGETTEYGPGLLDGNTASKLQIDSQYINAPSGSLIFKAPSQEELNQVFNEEVITGVVRVQKEGDIGVLNEEIGSNGTPPGTAKTTIALKEIPATIELEDNQTLQIYTDAGLIEGMVVNGDQTLTAGTGTVTIDSKTFSNYYANGGAKVREPAYSVGSRLTQNIYATSNSLVSIAELETHTNIGGGSAYSALTLKSRTDTNENGIATNVSSIATLETDVSILNDDVDANASSVLTLDSRVTDNEGDISANASAILSAESDISDLEGDVSANASATLSLDTRITTAEGEIDDIEATAVLKVDANGRIASVSLSASHDGSTISIRGDQIDINNIVFDDDGNIRTDNFSSGSSGWRIRGNGDAEFNNVNVRGSGSVITDGAKLENLTVTGTLTMDTGVIRNSGNTFSVDDDGFDITTSLSFSVASAYTIGGGTTGGLWGSSSRVVLESRNGKDVFIDSARDIRLDSGDDTILNNPNGDIYFLSLPNFNPNVSGVVYRDGNDLKISTG